MHRLCKRELQLKLGKTAPSILGRQRAACKRTGSCNTVFRRSNLTIVRPVTAPTIGVSMKEAGHTDKDTLSFYRTEAPVYTASGKGGVNRFLHGFLEKLDTGARILDLGCGGGRDSEEMLRRGFDVESWDASPAIARQAEVRTKRPVIVARFEDLEAEAAFDAIWASASLLHVPLASLPEILRRIHTALKPGGLHFANYKSGGSEGRDADGRYFNFLSKRQMLDAYAQSGDWKRHTVQEYVGGGYDHARQGPWVSLIASTR